MEPTSLPAITIGGASKLHVDVMGILTAMTATMKKTVSLQVLQFHLSPMKEITVALDNFFVMVGSVLTRQENVMVTLIVGMALMNRTAPR